MSIHESFKDLTFTEPKNTFKLTLIDAATGKIEKEIETHNTVGVQQVQKANQLYKQWTEQSAIAFTSIVNVGNGDINIALLDSDYGLTTDNAYSNVFKFAGYGDAVDTTQSFPFGVENIQDITHLNVTSTTGMVNGDTIIQYLAFVVNSVTDGLHLIVNDTTGMSNGDTIIQGPNTTTITTVTDGTHLVVGSTIGWLTGGAKDTTQFVSTTVSNINSATNITVGTTTAGWQGIARSGFYPTDSDGNDRLTAYNLANSLTNTGTKGGIYLPNLGGKQRNRAWTWTYEWGTTQGNGDVASLGFFPAGLVPGPSNISVLQVGLTPEMQNSVGYTYCGFKTSGLQKQLYFASRSVISNNVVIINHDDYSLVAQKTITNPTGLDGTFFNNILYTPVSGGQFYGVVSVQAGTPSITFKKTAESGSMTFGSPFSIPVTFPPNWTQVNVYNFTVDASFIYALVYNQDDSQSGILTIDPSTDSFVSIVVNPASFSGVNRIGDTELFNICPVTGKLFTRMANAGVVVVEWPSITRPDQNIPILYYQNNIFFGEQAAFLMYQTPDRLVGMSSENIQANSGIFYEFTKGNYFTYAVLPTPITKTGAQSLRVEYTLNF